ncbi:PhaM family polyhydroxyalkanoate granule multifunctional regulatory protein [Acidovorax sp. SUPP2539]|uniref:PhaM family polyhydroxyalkanoate granule multifunctional regulatory protein n=1 Tax=Acidovorax sp. SUPP2539 TaxID=2920878 RepID=UPI0023DE31F0|nr:PhaM family polyhydroxyalkanoate granule multifunctional regulatory protein [Acidovorax sp. SUPP2539]GKS92428.1 hypothetical protein AVTE2539_23705 [Acidovorax sp. SUPP2539]
MSDTSPFGFGRFVPGFDFLQNLAKGAPGGVPQMPSLSSWVAPTISVEELEKRIDELKAVQFWLEQNSRALSATVQALEVQKMTLATLKGMNVAMGDLAGAFAPKPSPSAPAPEPARASPAPYREPQREPPAEPPASEPAAEEDAASDPAATGAASTALPGVVDPMQWWGALTSQFQQIAAQAMGDASHQAAVEATRGAAAEAFKTATDMATQLAAQGLQGVQEATRMAQAPQDAKAPTARSRKPAAAPAAARTAAPRTRPAAAPKKAAARKPVGAPPSAARRGAAPAAAKSAAPRKRTGP